MSPPLGIYIFGFGGHARSVADVALASGIAELLFIDPAARAGEGFAGYAAVAILPAELQPDWIAIPAMGDNTSRRALFASIPLPMPPLIAPTASIGRDADMGEAVFVGHQAHIGPLAKIANGVIVNSGAVVDHETSIGEFCHVAVNATVAGRCRIGSGVMVGAGATVIDKITICDGAKIGAGATVVRDIVVPGTYVGTPARLLER